jgi:hypothetical protein
MFFLSAIKNTMIPVTISIGQRDEKGIKPFR